MKISFFKFSDLFNPITPLMRLTLQYKNNSSFVCSFQDYAFVSVCALRRMIFVGGPCTIAWNFIPLSWSCQNGLRNVSDSTLLLVLEGLLLIFLLPSLLFLLPLLLFLLLLLPLPLLLQLIIIMITIIIPITEQVGVAIALYICIPEVLCSKLGQCTGYPDWDFTGFSQFL
jgi:hypothetical protein